MLIEGRLGCGTKFIHLYFFCLVLVVKFILINILIAFVLDSYVNLKKENINIITKEDYDLLLNLWQDYDPQGTGWIKP